MAGLYVYFDVPHAISVHDTILEQSGGLPGIKSPEYIDSMIYHVQNDLYYPEFEDKLTHIFYSVTKNHAFNDGNKRTAIGLSAYFLEVNGFGDCVTDFIREMENIVVWVAEGKIDKELLLDLIASVIYDGEYSEELKLRLIEATKADLFL